VLRADDKEIAHADLPAPGNATTLSGVIEHSGGKLRVMMIGNSDKSAHENAIEPVGAPSVLMSMFAVEVDRP
jgi:hypothetical protein